MLEVNVREEVTAWSKSLDRKAQTQVPFALARALSKVARDAKAAVEADLPQRIDQPTPFTQRAFGTKGARKNDLTAQVFAKDLQSEYLSLMEDGGERKPKKQALVVPKGARLNRFGNLPKGLLGRLKGKPDVFVGTITFRRSGGTVGGIWQRPKYGKRRDGTRGTKGKLVNEGKTRTGLKLLVRFDGPRKVEGGKLGFADTVKATVGRDLTPALAEALREALATAR
jgi:hypothetical protein